MPLRHFVFAVLLSFPTLGAGGAVSFESTYGPTAEVAIIQDIGAAERLVAAARLRTLAHDVAGTACLLRAKVEPEVNRRRLIRAGREARWLLEALEFGNPVLGIAGAETDRRALQGIHDLRALWGGVSAVMASGGTTDDTLHLIAGTSPPLVQTAGRLVSDLSGRYSNPAELLQIDALMIQIASRQSAATLALLADHCGAWRQGSVLATGLVAQVSLGLQALHEGHEGMGLPAAPRGEISQALATVRADWSAVQAELTAARTPEDQTQALRQLRRLSVSLDRIVKLYAGHSKHAF